MVDIQANTLFTKEVCKDAQKAVSECRDVIGRQDFFLSPQFAVTGDLVYLLYNCFCKHHLQSTLRTSYLVLLFDKEGASDDSPSSPFNI